MIDDPAGTGTHRMWTENGVFDEGDDASVGLPELVIVGATVPSGYRRAQPTRRWVTLCVWQA